MSSGRSSPADHLIPIAAAQAAPPAKRRPPMTQTYPSAASAIIGKSL